MEGGPLYIRCHRQQAEDVVVGMLSRPTASLGARRAILSGEFKMFTRAYPQRFRFARAAVAGSFVVMIGRALFCAGRSAAGLLSY